MPTNSKKASTSKKRPAKRISKRQSLWQQARGRVASFLSRRPHRSFRLTQRREAVRPLSIPGNIALTVEVTRTLWSKKRIFLLLGVVYVLVYGLLVGIQSQAEYSAFSEQLAETGGDLFDGNWGAMGQAGILLVSIASANFNGGATDTQQLIAVFILLLTWLTTVWLLRNILAGHKVKLRDGLYSAGAPLLATIIVACVIAVQLLPVALAAVGYGAASTTGLIAGGGVAAMLFWAAAGLLAIVSLFWITSSLFAMVIVTLPGVYPFAALGAAGDIVLGRRVPILLRWLWLALVLVVSVAVIMIPVILIDIGLKNIWPAIEWLPIVPAVFVVIAAYSAIWSAAYVYMLYRKVVDSDR